MLRNEIKYFKLLSIALLLQFSSCGEKIKDFKVQNTTPLITPDYSDITLPLNIAPLNFYINEKGKKFHTEIYSESTDKMIIESSKPKVEINISKWHKLLHKYKGNSLFIDVYVKNESNQWTKYRTIKNQISQDSIDNYLVYRLINTGYILWHTMGIFQRNLQNFNESSIIENSSIGNGCINCHSFCKGNPSKMLVHIRKTNGGTIILNNEILKKINTKTKYTMAAGVYPSWHPSGNYVAFSVNLISQAFTTNKNKPIEVQDAASDIVIYDIRKNIITTSPKVSTKERENLPNWSSDGKMLYYIVAPKGEDAVTKYSLVRIPYDPEKNIWGDVDTIISAYKTGMSVSFPKPSPDGKYLLFCMTDYGYFTIYDANSDLYLLDLSNGKYRKLDINSNKADSYHSWSQNSRWFVFSSKRLDGLYTRPFICYIDTLGNVTKPFVLPQKDPLFYDEFLKNYNVPELCTGKIPISAQKIRDKIIEDAIPAKFDSLVEVDALSGATRIKKN
jgi:hypothetical protein